MARLFITPREIDYINDINKEILVDVIGQKIHLYPISHTKTLVHDVYRESPEKIFENPVEVFCRVAWQNPDVSTDSFGHEKRWRVEAYVPYRDMIDREIQVTPGDFFSFDSVFYEVLTVVETHNVFGQAEHLGGLKIVGRSSRKENFVAKIFGPTSELYTDPDAVQDTFVQQRGLPENREGVTGDLRDLQKKGIIEPIISQPAEVSPRSMVTGSNAASSFYDEV